MLGNTVLRPEHLERITAAPQPREIDHEELRSAPVDPRLRHLDRGTRAYISQCFDGDVDEAAFVATQFLNTRRCIPDWAAQIVGLARRGWKSFDRERC